MVSPFSGITVAPNAETLSTVLIPSWAIQCPISRPFTKYRQDTQTVEACCKCQSQTKCQAANGANHYNGDGAHAMMLDDGEIDRSEFSHLISKSYPLKPV